MELSMSLCFYFLCLYMLLVPRGNASEQYNELPEHYVLSIVPKHVSVNHGLLYTKFCENISAKPSKPNQQKNVNMISYKYWGNVMKTFWKMFKTAFFVESPRYFLNVFAKISCENIHETFIWHSIKHTFIVDMIST